MPYPINPTTIEASNLLLKEIVSVYGGTSAVGHLTGFDRRIVDMWVVRGYVPLASVHDAAIGLKVDVWSLSYYKLVEVFGESSKKFRDVVKKSPVAPPIRKKILKFYGAK